MGVLAVAGGAATAGAPDAASDGVGDADAAVGEDVGAADEDEDPRAPTAAAVGPEPKKRSLGRSFPGLCFVAIPQLQPVELAAPFRG